MTDETTTPSEEAFTRVLGLGASDLTRRAERAELGRAYLREREVESVFDSLLIGRSVLLVGPSGVGKTAIINEVAQRLALGPCPAALRGKRVVQVSFNAATCWCISTMSQDCGTRADIRTRARASPRS